MEQKSVQSTTLQSTVNDQDIEEIILVDVDRTVILKRERINSIFYGINTKSVNEWKEKLKNNKRIKVVFFSNMDLSDMNFVPEPPVPEPDEYPKKLNHITREDAINVLKSEGIPVDEVITPADVNHNKGLGAAYRDFYLPAYKACLANPHQYHEDKRKPGSYQKQYEACLDFSKHPGYTGKGTAEFQKGLMFKYFLEKFPNADKIKIHYYDDDNNCLNKVREIHGNLENHGTLETHLVKEQDEEKTPLLIIGEAKCKEIEGFVGKGRIELRAANVRLNDGILKKLALSELHQLEVFYQYFRGFKSAFNAAINDIAQYKDFPELINSLGADLEKNPDAVRRKIATYTAMMIEETNPHLYNKMIQASPNGRFSSSHSDTFFFNYYPDLIPTLFQEKSGELRQICNNMLHDLEEKLNNYERFNGRVVRLQGAKDPSALISSMRSSVKEVPSKIQARGPFWKENPEEATDLRNILMQQIIPTLRECNKIIDPINNRKAPPKTGFNP